MLDASGRGIHLGDIIEVRGRLRGVVVCVIDDGEFTADYPKAEWAYLERGVLLDTAEAGVVHCTDEQQLVLMNSSAP
jgi:hypothetical protein